MDWPKPNGGADRYVAGSATAFSLRVFPQWSTSPTYIEPYHSQTLSSSRTFIWCPLLLCSRHPFLLIVLRFREPIPSGRLLLFAPPFLSDVHVVTLRPSLRERHPYNPNPWVLRHLTVACRPWSVGIPTTLKLDAYDYPTDNNSDEPFKWGLPGFDG